MIFERMLERARLWLWARKTERKQASMGVVIDSNILLTGEERDRLAYLKKIPIILPVVVWEEIEHLSRKMAGQSANSFRPADRESKEEAARFMKEMVKRRKNWDLAGSSGSGLVRRLAGKKTNFSPWKTWEETLGINDLRVFATCLNLLKTNLKMDRVVLITKDKNLKRLVYHYNSDRKLQNLVRCGASKRQNGNGGSMVRVLDSLCGLT